MTRRNVGQELTADMFTASDRTRFWDKVARTDDPSDCWEWTGFRNAKGYGLFRKAERVHPAQRVAYALGNGPIAAGLVVRHRCDNPPCCNPAHLVTGTYADNSRDAVKRGRQARGENQGLAVLTMEQVTAARRGYRDGRTPTELAEELGVPTGTLSGALYKGWADSPEPPVEAAINTIRTAEEHADLARRGTKLMDAGMTWRAAARELGVTTSVLRRAMELTADYGVEHRRRIANERNRKRAQFAIDRLAAGGTVRDAAAELGVSESSLSAWVHRFKGAELANMRDAENRRQADLARQGADLMDSGMSRKRAAEELGVPPHSLRTWQFRHLPDRFTGSMRRTDEQRRDIARRGRELMASGMTRDQAAEELGVPTGTLSNYLNWFPEPVATPAPPVATPEVAPAPPEVTAEVAAAARSVILDGGNLDDAAAAVHVPRGVLADYLQNHPALPPNVRTVP